jgi:mRNA interferase RelE/StbE
MHYGLSFLPAALAEWKSLATSLKQQFQAQLRRRLKQPRPSGSELRGLLRGHYKIKLRKSGYRLVYRVDEANRRLVVTAVGPREPAGVYAEALQRIT